MCNLLSIDYLEIGSPNYYYLGIACVLLLIYVYLTLKSKYDESIFQLQLARQGKLLPPLTQEQVNIINLDLERQKEMLGKAPPDNVYTVEMLVTVECKAYNKSDARTKAFDIVNFASQESDEHVSISSISIDKVTDNNVQYEELG